MQDGVTATICDRCGKRACADWDVHTCTPPPIVARLERWQADATAAINAAMSDMEWDALPGHECGPTWAYVAEFQRLVGHPLAPQGEG